MTEFKKGDRVSIMATVTEDYDPATNLLVSIHVDGTPKSRTHHVKDSRLTFVERPVRKVTVTLTEDEVRWLASATKASSIGNYPVGLASKLIEANNV